MLLLTGTSNPATGDGRRSTVTATYEVQRLACRRLDRTDNLAERFAVLRLPVRVRRNAPFAGT
jgi:hypothetical protein